MNVYMDTINCFGHSYLDWEYAKRKQKEPNLSFDDVLKESMDKLKDEDKVVKNKRGRAMTREEAIAYFKDMNECTYGDVEPIQMAIKALEQEPVLDKIRAEVIAKYPKNYAGEPELGGCACEFSLNQVLQIIDKYKAEMEGEE